MKTSKFPRLSRLLPRGRLAALAWLLMAAAIPAEPVYGPEDDPNTDSWPVWPISDLYTLVAKVKGRSVDRGTECVYWQGPGDDRGIGHPLDAELLEVLWKADDFDPACLLVPARFELQGMPRPDPDLEAGRYAEGEVMALVCRREGEWSIVQWIVPAGTWEKYRCRKEDGTLDSRFSPERDAEEECDEAFDEIRKLRARMEAGELSFEEYLRLREPFWTIICCPKFGTLD